MHSKGFTYFARPNARVLVLGSLPGQTSLAEGQYYAQKHNAFWRIMDALVGAGPQLPYPERMKKLTASGIALWDVCAEGLREGSLDSAIRDCKPNDFAAFYRAHKNIGLICFNGSKAAEIYRRKVLPGLPAAVQATPQEILPSTSPAHASKTFETKLAQWREALRDVLG